VKGSGFRSAVTEWPNTLHPIVEDFESGALRSGFDVRTQIGRTLYRTVAPCLRKVISQGHFAEVIFPFSAIYYLITSGFFCF